MSPERGRDFQDNLVVYLNKQEDVERIVNQHIRQFDTTFSKFFETPDLAERRKTGKRVLAIHDYVIADEVLGLAVPMGNYAVTPIPYNDVIEGYLTTIERLRNPDISLIRESSEGILNGVQAALPPKLEKALKQRAYFTRTHFILTKDADINRAVEQIKVFADRRGEQVGELWIGSKWKPNFKEISIPTVKRKLAAA
jgi:hypothetical protein